MARRHLDDDTAEQQPMTKRLLKDAAKQPDLIPNGIWELRCVGALKVSEGAPKDGEDPFRVAVLLHEPFAATDSVDPEEVEAVDAHGKSRYAGRRIYSRFQLPRDQRRLAQALIAHGLDPNEVEVDDDGALVESQRALVRGTIAKGNVERYSFKDKITGETRSDNQVKIWMPV